MNSPPINRFAHDRDREPGAHAPSCALGQESPALTVSPSLLFAGRFVLIWHMVITVWPINKALRYAGKSGAANWTIVVGLSFLIWNIVAGISTLESLAWSTDNKSSKALSQRQKITILAGQLCFALLASHFALHVNPDGMRYWYWMALPAYAGLLLRLPEAIIAGCISIIVATGHVWFFEGTAMAINWVTLQTVITIFITICTVTAAHAAREGQRAASLALELRDANFRLENQADQIALLAVAQERNLLAREIHDVVGHCLTVVGAQLDAAAALIRTSPDRALEAIQKARQSSQVGLAEIRASVSSLRSSPLHGHTLIDSMERMLTTFERPGVRIDLRQSGEPRQLPAMVEMTLYRCAQEALTNACRHANATEIDLHLDFTSPSETRLAVSDNGPGFNDFVREGHGLKGLRERATLLHGEFESGTGLYGGGLCEIRIPA